MFWLDEFIEYFFNDVFLNFPNKWWWLLILRWYYFIDLHWLKDGSWYFPLFSTKGQVIMVVWCLLVFLRCYFQSTMCICLSCVLFGCLVWSSCIIGIEGYGGRRRGLGCVIHRDGHQCFSWNLFDMRTRVLSTWFHNARNIHSFKMNFFDVSEWPCDPLG